MYMRSQVLYSADYHARMCRLLVDDRTYAELEIPVAACVDMVLRQVIASSFD